MRLVAAIIAAVMSVATGGPLRCPCQFAALFRNTPCTDQSAVRTLPTTQPSDLHSCCGCKTQTTDDEPPPAEHQPDQPEPCSHGPGIDLVAPSTVDRQSGDLGAEGAPFAATSGAFLSLRALVRHDLAERPPGSDTSLHARLRFSHAFRC
jgi:hypothetical protein